uniref:C-type lectin domain-containing protein n=1 Tax=Panagrolaimus sp. JU765 TaxID=591449 RepID=A0AC34PVF4_9BILA
MIFLTVFIFLSLLFDGIVGDCPRGSLASLKDSSKCYSFISSTAEFLNAEQTCVDLRGHLASVSDGFLNAFLTENGQNIYGKVNATDFWIGGSDLAVSSNWTWTDGSAWGYTSWASGEPNNNPGSDCVSSRLADGLWLASNCFGRKPFICQVPPLPVVKCPSFCDSEWAFFNESDSCYKAFHNSKWNDAEATCVENGAHLASIHSDAENSFVAALARTGLSQSTPHQSWIGLYTNTRNAQWNWTDSSPVDFYNWAPSQPDNPGGENCVQLFSDNSEWASEAKWYEKYQNYDCNKEVRAFVCKKPSNKV